MADAEGDYVMCKTPLATMSCFECLVDDAVNNWLADNWGDKGLFE